MKSFDCCHFGSFFKVPKFQKKIYIFNFLELFTHINVKLTWIFYHFFCNVSFKTCDLSFGISLLPTF